MKKNIKILAKNKGDKLATTIGEKPSNLTKNLKKKTDNLKRLMIEGH